MMRSPWTKSTLGGGRNVLERDPCLACRRLVGLHWRYAHFGLRHGGYIACGGHGPSEGQPSSRHGGGIMPGRFIGRLFSLPARASDFPFGGHHLQALVCAAPSQPSNRHRQRARSPTAFKRPQRVFGSPVAPAAQAGCGPSTCSGRRQGLSETGSVSYRLRWCTHPRANPFQACRVRARGPDK